MNKEFMDLSMVVRFLALMILAWQPFIGGPRIPSFLLFFIGLALIFRKQIDFRSEVVHRLGIIFLLLFIPVILSIPTSFDVKGSVVIALALIVFFVVSITLIQGLKSAEEHRWLTKWLFIVLMLWLFDAYFQLATGTDILGVPLSPDGRVIGPFESNLRLGLFLTVLMPLILWNVAKKQPILCMGLILAIGVIAAFSGARTYLFNLLLGVLVLLPAFRWPHRLALTSSLVLAVGLAASLSPAISERLQRFTTLDHGPEKSMFETMDRILSGRASIWNTASIMVKDRPVSGVGAGAFSEAYPDYAREGDMFFSMAPTHAHNMYISVMAESGFIGLMGLVLAVIFLIKWYLKAAPPQRQTATPYALSLAVLAFPIHSQPVLYVMWWFPVVLLLVTGLVAALTESKVVGSVSDSRPTTEANADFN